MHALQVLALALCASSVMSAPLLGARENNVNPDAENTKLIADLDTAATAVDRLALLKNPSDFVFDFKNSKIGITSSKGKRCLPPEPHPPKKPLPSPSFPC